MANIIRIKRRATGAAGAPTSLQNAELAFNEVDNVLYYGKGTGGAGGTATTVDPIGGFGAFLALTGDQTVNGVKTFNSTIVGNIDTASKLLTARTVDITGDATWQVTFDGSSNVTSALTLANTGVTAGTYGSATAIPTFTVDSKGRLTAAGTVSVATVLNIAGDTGTDGISLLSDTFTVTGGDGVTTTVGTNAVTIDADATIARRADTHYIGTTAVALNRTSANLALTGITSITLPGSTSGTAQIIPTAAAGTGTVITLPASSGTVALTNNKLSVFAATTSAELAGVISDETGSGALVFATSPTLVTPTLGVASATSINKVSITAPATGSTLTIADGKALTVSNTLTFTGTDASSVAFGAGGTVVYRADKLSVHAATTSAELAGVISDETGTGVLVFGTSPTFTTSVVTGSTSFDVFNTTATTVNAFGAVQTLNIGNATYGKISTSASNVTIASGTNATNSTVTIQPQGTGTVNVSNKRITSVADPTQAQDAATKAYVDAVKTGLTVKDSARVATTGTLTVTYANGTAGVGATLTNAGTQAALTLDSIVLNVGDRVLVKDQTAALQNGIYTVTNVGSASTNWVLTRATDFDQSPDGEIGGGDFVFVQEGTANADNGYVVTTNGTITVGTTSIDWAQFSGAGQITAGAGLTKTGNTIDVGGTANRITINADSVDIASTYVGQTSITTLGTVGTGTWQGTVIAGQYGGTGVNNNGKTITLGGNLTTSGAFATTLTVTATTNVTLPTTGTLATLAGTETFTNKTISTGSTWQGNIVAVSYGGTGASTFTSKGIIYGNGTGALQVTQAGTWDATNSIGQILSVDSSGTPIWTNTIDGGAF